MEGITVGANQVLLYIVIQSDKCIKSNVSIGSAFHKALHWTLWLAGSIYKQYTFKIYTGMISISPK